MSLKTISVAQARELHAKGALLIDVREPGEFAREHIPGAQLHPLSTLKQQRPDTAKAEVVVFMCQSGMRTNAAAANLKISTDCDAYILEGGLSGWKQAGLPTETNDAVKAPLSLVRQVLIVAGSAAAIGFALGVMVDPAWHALSGLVGAGLAFAGFTGFCPLATLLARMPWNTTKSASAALN